MELHTSGTRQSIFRNENEGSRSSSNYHLVDDFIGMEADGENKHRR